MFQTTGNLTETHIANLVTQAERDGIQKMVVGAVIAQQGKVLVLQRHPQEVFLANLVELPSGTVELGESLIAALKREVREETGLHITAINTFAGCFDYLSKSGKKTRQFNFAVDVADGTPVLSSEHAAYSYIGSAEIATLNISPETQSVIRDYLSIL